MKFNLSLDISWNERISSVLAILFVATLALLVAKITLDAADKVKNEFSQSPALSLQKKMLNSELNGGNEAVTVPANANVKP